MNRERVEQVLRKVMFTFGSFVERVIGQARKAKVSVSSGGGLTPVLALESQIPLTKLRELISRASFRIVSQFIPVAGAKPALELGEGSPVFFDLLKERGAAQVIHVNIGGVSMRKLEGRKAGGSYEVYAQVKKIPFDDNFFGLAIACLTTPFQGELVKAVKEVGRLVQPGGDAILTDFHPYGLYAKKGGVRLKPREANIRGLEDYYKVCKVAGFKVVDVKEVFIDEAMRPFFSTPEEKIAFKNVKDTPLVLCLFAKKVE